MRLNPPGAGATIERRVDVHIFLFLFALDTRADGAACQSEGTEAKEMERGGKRERERDIGGGSRNEIEVGSKGEAGSLPTKERERESEKGLGMRGNGERETRKRDEELCRQKGWMRRWR